MKKEKSMQWSQIKAEYLQGYKPDELAKKYGLTAKKISDKANKDKWVAEKSEIFENVRKKVEDDIQKNIERISNKAINRLENILDDDSAANKDVVAAAKAILDISGLKKSKQEITGKNGEQIVQQIYATPEEYKKAIKHIQEVVSNA